MTKDKPPIDRTAEEAVSVPMPGVAENAPPSIFVPGSGVTTLDVLEVALMTVIQLFNGPEVAPGALRSQMMKAERVAQLSPEAQRWMKEVQPAAAPPTT